LDSYAVWHADWVWSLPLIVLTVVTHVLGLGLINERIVGRVSNRVNPRHLTALFVAVMAAAALMVTVLLAFDGAIWAAVYRVVGATRQPLGYALLPSAITCYGHANIFLDPHWQMMGALEALNGMILFGLTTAFMFGMIQAIWPIGRGVHGRHD
jgi:hypothetical protein